MTSEKSRYMNRKQKPQSPFSTSEIVASAASLPQKRLIEIVELRADWDETLLQILCVSLAIRSNAVATAKAAIDNVMSINEPIRYNECGHGQILYEIERELKTAADNGTRDYVIEVGRYAIEQAQAVAEMFEDDWDWSSSIESLEKYIDSLLMDSDSIT